VEPWSRVPFIGTAVVALPERATALLYARMRRCGHLNFELHGIDLLDASDVGFPPLSRAQRELRVPARRKRERLAAVLRRVRDDFDVVTLEVAAARFEGR
jgi:peptidoglycan-N-acetylglucosamine deacetylase